MVVVAAMVDVVMVVAAADVVAGMVMVVATIAIPSPLWLKSLMVSAQTNLMALSPSGDPSPAAHVHIF